MQNTYNIVKMMNNKTKKTAIETIINACLLQDEYIIIMFAYKIIKYIWFLHIMYFILFLL